MDRFASAGEKFGSARRHLYSVREEGEEASFRAALEDVRSGLDLLDFGSLDSPAARAAVAILRQALKDPAPDRLRLSAAVDDLASWLYWTETSRAS